MVLQRSLLALCGLVAFTTACSDNDTGILGFVTPTEVAVDPLDFLGDLKCSIFEDAPRSYVLTLYAYEDENDLTPFPIGSSPAATCSQVQGFREASSSGRSGGIIVGQRYTGEVDVYDVPPTELTPFGGTSSGARQMLDPETGEAVAPRWQTRCGTGAEASVQARDSRRVLVRPCETLTDSAPTTTRIAISPSLILGDEPCDVAATIDILPQTGDLQAAVDVACDAEPVIWEVAPGSAHTFYVSATVDGDPQGTTCLATATPGQQSAPICNPLASEGRIRLSLAGLTDGDEAVCPEDAFFDVFIGDEVQNAIAIGCSQQVTVGALLPGDYDLEALVFDAEGAELGTVLCSATVLAGDTTTAECSPAPPG